jgi:hypothetical protein
MQYSPYLFSYQYSVRLFHSAAALRGGIIGRITSEEEQQRLFTDVCSMLISFFLCSKLPSQHKICLDEAAIVSHMFTSHSIDSCKKLLHHYGEFTNFIGHVLAITEEAIINGESNKEP